MAPKMRMERFIPSEILKPYIREFLIIESDLNTDSKTLPDTAMVMAFRYRGNVQKLEGDWKEAIPASVVSGLRRSSRIFHYSRQTANLLVVFNEGGFSAFSKIPAHELFGVSVPSENLFRASELSEILEQLAEAKTNRMRVDLIESLFLKKLINGQPNPLIHNAIRLIKKQNGIIRIKDLADSLNFSQDPFEKRFRALVGSTPKQYASIVRLRNLITKYPSYTSLTEASYEAGYFDQSHFIKDFRQFTGQAPKEFFKSPQFW